MATSFEQSSAPGIAKTILNGSATGAGPLAVAMPAIPAYGRYFAVVTAWHGNDGDRAYAWYLVDYYKAATSNAALAAQQIGATTTTPGQMITGLTLGAPTSTGVMTATIATTRASSAGKVQVELFELSGVMDQFSF